MLMTDAALDAIEQRVRLWADYGDQSAAWSSDAVALVAEVRELRAQREHLIAMHRKAIDDLAALELRHAEEQARADRGAGP
jgi:hypothetical protein